MTHVALQATSTSNSLNAEHSDSQYDTTGTSLKFSWKRDNEASQIVLTKGS